MRRHRHISEPISSFAQRPILAEHPVLETIYRFKHRLCYLLLKKHRTRKQCEQLVPRFPRAVYQLRQADFPFLFRPNFRVADHKGV
jgi:hypothetical protein